MNTDITPEDCRVSKYDPCDYLDSPEAIAAFLDEAVATGDAKFVAHCLGLVAKAVGMGKVAKDAGLNRQSLYKSLSGDMAPRIDTMLAVLQALGLEMHISEKQPA